MREHKTVLRGIDSILEELNTAQNCALFIQSSYVASNGKANKEYLLTRDGFTLAVMGFTGTKALQFKLKYIQAFNEMEQELLKSKFQIPQTYAEANFGLGVQVRLV